MLKFSRRIRQKLLAGGNLKGYLTYAIGEILRVMIGILLALQLNNLNEHKKKRDLVKSQLLNLVASLKSDSAMWANTLHINEFRSSSFEYLIKKAGQTLEERQALPKADSTFIWQGPYPDSLDINFIRTSFRWFTHGFNNTTIDRTAITEIKNLGLYSEIRNNKLRNRIHKYYMFIAFRFGDENVQRRTSRDDEFHDYLRDNFGVRANDISHIGDPIAFIKNDDGIIFRLKEVRAAANYHSRQAIDAINKVHEIIEMIETEVVY
ncbi:MAG: hypothetical protein HKN87_04715 [Saprospiraceae bacterium]|nr:hypothetical protein [Saprospiraceae bacterium]